MVKWFETVQSFSINDWEVLAKQYLGFWSRDLCLLKRMVGQKASDTKLVIDQVFGSFVISTLGGGGVTL